MDLPQIPTDNLYRFMAIAGLVVVIAGCVYPSIKVYALEERVLDAELKSKLLDDDVDAMKEKLRLAKAGIVPVAELEDPMRAIEKANRQFNSEHERIKLLRDQATLIRYACLAAVAAGTFSAWFGFKLWYQKIQRPADQLVQLQINQLAQSTPTSEQTAEHEPVA